ncbi:MAG: hypothetical protein GY953_38060, partial [bacterium]|nr:hypothetical protein [bacterium]
MKFDPSGEEILWSTRVGGNGSDTANAMAIDPDGNIYVGGFTQSANYPRTPDALQPGLRGEKDAAIVVLSPDGAQMLFSTHFGGTTRGTVDNLADIDEDIFGMAVSPSGRLFAGGFTTSTDFPVTGDALPRNSPRTAATLFVIDVEAGSVAPARLVYSTTLVAPGERSLGGSVLLGDDVLYFAGNTSGSVSRGTGILQPVHGGERDGFVCKLGIEPAISFERCTHLGGSADDFIGDLKFGPHGSVYIGGSTISADFPTTPGAFITERPGTNLIPSPVIAKIGPDLSTLEAATFTGAQGGTGPELAIAADGTLYGAYFSNRGAHPLTPDAFQDTPPGAVN